MVVSKRDLIALLSGLLCLSGLSVSAQFEVNLAEALQEQQIKAVNRTLSPYENHPEAVEMNAEEGDGLGILTEIEFETGIIELQVLGENSPGRSFVGLAFNIEDEETFEAIYFRPFNFVAEEQGRKDHMVQYVCHPKYTWSKLRKERTGEFENEFLPPPDPDDWFWLNIEISKKEVVVYSNISSEPVLEVKRLARPRSDKIGLWVGNGSSGRFRYLQVNSF